MTGKYRIHLIGALCGPIWWPVGHMSGIRIDIDLVSEAGRINGKATLRDLALLIFAERGGDFQGCKFTCDSHILVKRAVVASDRARYVSRLWEITAFKSIADLIDGDHYAADLT